MFGRTAKKLTEELAKSNSSVSVAVNEEKPGKGNFVVSVGTKTIVSLKAMPRPFKALRELDIVEVAQDIVKAI